MQEPSPRGLESEGKGQGSRGKATRRAGLPGSRGTRQADANGPRVPSSPRPCSRGAGNRERPRPEGPVTRSRPNRTRPAAPPSSLPLPSLHPAARYPGAAALTSGCTEPAAASAAACASAAAAASLLRLNPGGASASRRRRLCHCRRRQSRTPQNGGTSGTYHRRGGPRRRGRAAKGNVPPRRRPPARIRAERRVGAGRGLALQRPLRPGSG